MFKAMIIAGLGGFIGTCLRFLTGKLAHVITVSAFPWGTFAVNIIGSFVIGIFFGLAEKTHVISPSMNVFLITGFCGGFTTFSSFADDHVPAPPTETLALFRPLRRPELHSGTGTRMAGTFADKGGLTAVGA